MKGLAFSDLDFLGESSTSAQEQRWGSGYPRLSVLLRQAADRTQPLAGRSYPFPGQRAGLFAIIKQLSIMA